MAQSLSNPDLIEKGRNRRDLSLVIVPSRVDNSEKKLLDDFQDEFDKKFRKYIPNRMRMRLESLQKSDFLYLKIPYVPFYSFKEKVAVRDADKASASDLSEAYGNLVSALIKLSPELYKKTHPNTGLLYLSSLAGLCQHYSDGYPNNKWKRVFGEDQDILRKKIIREWNDIIPPVVDDLITAIYQNEPIDKSILESANKLITEHINATLDLENDDQAIDNPLKNDNIESDDIQPSIESKVSVEKQNDSFFAFVGKILFSKTEST
jgi:hypothetical protein